MERTLLRFAIPAGAAFLGLMVVVVGLTRGLDEAVYDQLSTRLIGPPDAPGAILVAIDEPSLQEIGPWPWPRAVHGALVESLRNAGASSISFDILFADPKDLADDGALIAAMGDDVVLARDVEVIDTPQGLIRQDVLPIPELLAFGARTGFVGMPLDFDGAMRRMPRAGSFAEQIARLASPPEGARIAFAGPASTYPRVSFYQALQAEIFLPSGFFQEADVIVGFALRSAIELDSGIPDHFRTPWTIRGEGLMPGIEVHANTLDTLRLERWILPLSIGWVAALAAALGALSAWLAAHRSALMAAMFTVGLTAVPIAASAAALSASTWLPPVGLSLAAFAGGIGQTLVEYARERARRRTVITAFGRYLAPAMVERLAQDPSLLKLGGERRELTILFCDIRGFTAISELMKDDPEGLTELVNRLLTPIAEAILDHDGTIDKFIGDCVMGIWNAPLDVPDHRSNAVAAGHQIVAGIETLSQQISAERQQANLPPLGVAVGVGINTGTCVVGNMGTQKRFDYTAIGDAVNLAARLEARTKYYGLNLIAGGETGADLSDLIEIDRIAVKGKAELTAIYGSRAVFGGTDAQVKALSAYRAQDWDYADSVWQALAEDAPDAALYINLMRDRIAAFRQNPPPQDWDGGWRFDEK